MKSLCLSFFSFPLAAPACFSCSKHTNLSSHFFTLGGNFIWTTSLLYISLAWMSAFICHSIWSTHLTPAHFRWDGSLVHTHFLSVFFWKTGPQSLLKHTHKAGWLGGYETHESRWVLAWPKHSKSSHFQPVWVECIAEDRVTQKEFLLSCFSFFPPSLLVCLSDGGMRRCVRMGTFFQGSAAG